jgi:hypothetical protein
MSTIRKTLVVFASLPLLWALAGCPGPTNTNTNNAPAPNANHAATPNANQTPQSNANNANQTNANTEQSNANDARAVVWCKYAVKTSGCPEIKTSEIVCIRCVAGKCPRRRGKPPVNVTFKGTKCRLEFNNDLSDPIKCEACPEDKRVELVP